MPASHRVVPRLILLLLLPVCRLGSRALRFGEFTEMCVMDGRRKSPSLPVGWRGGPAISYSNLNLLRLTLPICSVEKLHRRSSFLMAVLIAVPLDLRLNDLSSPR